MKTSISISAFVLCGLTLVFGVAEEREAAARAAKAKQKPKPGHGCRSATSRLQSVQRFGAAGDQHQASTSSGESCKIAHMFVVVHLKCTTEVNNAC
eukprot:5910176-Amphidinium_carterae.1